MPDLSMDFNSRYYLIESVQQVVDVIGENCIVTGLDVLSTNLSDRGLLTINLSKGKVICDKTLIDFPDNETLELDISSLPSVGDIVLSISFKYLRTSRPNLASFSLKYLTVVHLNNNDFACSEWFLERDKILISHFYYNKTSLDVITHESTLKESYSISINNQLYEARPFNYIIQQLRPLLALI